MIPESCDVVPMGSVSFDIAPVYGQDGVELSGFGAELNFCVLGFGNDSERCLVHSFANTTWADVSLKR